MDAGFYPTQSKVSISLFSFLVFMGIYIWQLKCYVELVIVWVPPTTNSCYCLAFRLLFPATFFWGVPREVFHS